MDTLTELTYAIGMKKSNQIEEFLSRIRKLERESTLIAGYNGSDL